MNHQLKEKLSESVSSVLPITAIVLLLSISVAPLDAGVMVLFVFGAIMLIFGMGLFTLGADMSMIPLGEGIGVQMSKTRRHLIWPLLTCLIVGVLITVAEPDLQVLATQIPGIPNPVIILAVAVGVGIFLVIAMLRILFRIPLNRLLIIFYALVFILAYFSPNDFIPAAFDSGGVTTGPMTVPFIMALGIGLASLRSDKNSGDDSFGLVALCSIGPFLSVLLLGLFYTPDVDATQSVISMPANTRDAVRIFAGALPDYAYEIAVSLLPIFAVFVVFQLLTRRYHGRQILRIISGFVFTYLGLVLFLVGANVGFMPAGSLIGQSMATQSFSWLLIPVGMVVGYFIVAAEPAVHVLKKQVEEVSNGAITQKTIGHGLSIGVAVSVGIAMLRILTGISIIWFLIPGYAISLLLSFHVPPIYTGIAFDSGGVASGPMTATFLLPLAMGACTAIGGNLMTDAFGIVAMVAMTPLITIQLIGFHSEVKKRIAKRTMVQKLSQLEDCILYFDEEGEAAS